MPHLFIADLGAAAAGESVDIIGFARQVRNTRDHYAVEVVDISGAKWFRLPRPGPKPKRGERIGLSLQPTSDASGDFAVTKYRVVATSPSSGEEADVERLERGSRLMLSRVVMKAGEFLRHEDFVEFDSRIIVADDPQSGLEPMQLRYPGFGSPVTLATSPAGQIIDFMNATGVSRAFTTSTSFSTSYRFPRASVESRVVMGKMKDLRGEPLRNWMLRLSGEVLSFLDRRAFGATTESEQLDRFSSIGLTLDEEVLNSRQKTHIGSHAERVFRLQSQDRSIIIEAYEEQIGQRFVFSGFTLYPAHLLELTEMSPLRHVRYFKRATNWSD